MRGIGRLLRVLFRSPVRAFGCLVFILGGGSLATWPLATVGTIVTLITLLTMVAGLTLFWRDAGWFRRLWVGGLMLAVVASVIALLNLNTPRGLVFQVVAGLALLPSLIAATGYVWQQRLRGRYDMPAQSLPTSPPAPTDLPPPLQWQRPVITDLPPPLPWLRTAITDPSTPASRQVSSPDDLPMPLQHESTIPATDLLDRLLNTPPEK